MFITTILLLTGLALIIGGATFMTDGAALVARKFNISEFIIGLTIIAIGTSAPEIVVSIGSAMKGSSEMAVGNVVGSNMFNTFIIVGVVALIQPIRLSRETCLKTLPMTLYASLLLLLFCSHLLGLKFMPNKIYWFEGVVMLGGFVYFMVKSIKAPTSKSYGSKRERENIELKPILKGAAMAIIGLSILLYGGDIFIDSAVKIATAAGISKYVISVTLLGGGTSMPELVSSIIATRKGMPQMALGNVLGSNIANILLVLGTSAIITPLSLQSSSIVDILLVSIGSLLLIATIYTFKKHQIDRIEGAILVAIYIIYVIYLVAGS